MKNKDKYDLTKLTFKIEGEKNPSQAFKILDGTNVVFEKPILLNRVDLSLFLSWLEEEYKPNILGEKEKEYLAAVIKPFRDVVLWIKKESIEGYKEEWISIGYKSKNNNGFGVATLPNFKTGTLYKDMEADKQYNLKELEL